MSKEQDLLNTTLSIAAELRARYINNSTWQLPEDPAARNRANRLLAELIEHVERAEAAGQTAANHPHLIPALAHTVLLRIDLALRAVNDLADLSRPTPNSPTDTPQN